MSDIGIAKTNPVVLKDLPPPKKIEPFEKVNEIISTQSMIKEASELHPIDKDRQDENKTLPPLAPPSTVIKLGQRPDDDETNKDAMDRAIA